MFLSNFGQKTFPTLGRLQLKGHACNFLGFVEGDDAPFPEVNHHQTTIWENLL